MFRIVSSRIGQRTPLGVTSWELATVLEAVELLGWHGEVHGPVEFGGVRFVAVIGHDEFGAPGGGWLQGCLVSVGKPREAVQDASLLAGYSPRAVLLRDPEDTVGLQLETALLDQGAVIETDGELMLLSKPGPTTPSPLQVGDVWRTDARWLSMRDAICAAERLATVPSS